MSPELIAVIVSLLTAWVNRARKESKLAAVAGHAIAQNTEILSRQTGLIERCIAIQEQLLARVEALEEEEQPETVVAGFRVEDEDEEEDEEDQEEDPLNKVQKSRAHRR